MLLEDFDYDLPEERIAQTPIEPRNASRLMVLNPVEKTISHDHFYNLKKYIVPGDTLIFNDTRVMPARLIGHRDKTGGKVEVFLLRRLDADHWETLVKPGKKAQVGNVINFSDELSCIVTEHTDFGGRVVNSIMKVFLRKSSIVSVRLPCRHTSTKNWKTKIDTRRYIIGRKALPPHRRQDSTSPKSRCRNSRIWAFILAL